MTVPTPTPTPEQTARARETLGREPTPEEVDFLVEGGWL
jgi:hypothetical protein